MRRWVAVGVLVVLLPSCTRTQHRPASCPPPPPLPDVEIVTDRAAEDGRLHGRIIDRATGDPVSGAMVLLDGPAAPDSLLASEAGRFEVRTRARGTVIVRTNSLGFRVRVDTLHVELDRVLEAVFPMEYMTLDRCGFGVVVERRLWWKIW